MDQQKQETLLQIFCRALTDFTSYREFWISASQALWLAPHVWLCRFLPQISTSIKSFIYYRKMQFSGHHVTLCNVVRCLSIHTVLPWVTAGIKHNFLPVTPLRPAKTERTWMCLSSTLLLQLVFVHKISCNTRRKRFWGSRSDVDKCVVTCLAHNFLNSSSVCASLHTKQRDSVAVCFYQSCISASLLESISSTITATTHTQSTQLHIQVHIANNDICSISTPTLAPTYTQTQHPANWCVTMETECLPNRRSDGGSKGEGE